MKKKNRTLDPPLEGVLKYNVDGVAREKPEPTGIGGILYNSRVDVLISFSKSIEVRDSNETEVLAIHEALRIYSSSFHKSLIVEGDLQYNFMGFVGW